MGKSSEKSTTKIEADPAMIKITKPLKEGKREAEDDLETKAKQLKKQKKKSEKKETMDFLQLMDAKMDLLTTKVDLLTSKVDLFVNNGDLQKILASLKELIEISSSDESSSDEDPSKVPAKDSSSSSEDESEDDSQDDKVSNVYLLRQKAASPTSKAASSSDLVAAESGNISALTPTQSSVQTIYVEGFGTSLPEDDIKTALSKHFSVCGEVTRVSVPTSLETGAVKGFAYIDLKEDAKKALQLNGSVMIGKELVVKMALLMRDSNPGYSGSDQGFGGRFGRLGGLYVGGRFHGGRCGGLNRCFRGC